MTSERLDEKLLPCPFCRSAPFWDGPLVICCSNEKCMAEVSGYNTAAETLAAWNNRVRALPTSKTAGAVEPVVRYRCTAYGSMAPEKSGSWVLYSDYQSALTSLQDELERVKADAEKWAEKAMDWRTRLTARNAELEEALEPFAKASEELSDAFSDDWGIWVPQHNKRDIRGIRVSDLRKAARTLKKGGEDG